MKKVEVTTELIKEVHNQVSADLKQRIEKELPDLFNKLEVGRWYKKPCGILFNFQGKYSYCSDSGSYGFGPSTKWYENIGIGLDESDKYILATEEEVKTALVNEAVKRGFVKGITFKSVEPNQDGEQIIKIDSDIYYSNSGGYLYASCGYLFKDGKWATLITEPTEKELLGDKIKDLEKNLEEVKSLYNKL